MVTISPDALVFHLAGKSPTASCMKSSTATTFSPGTKSNLLYDWKVGTADDGAPPAAGAFAFAGAAPEVGAEAGELAGAFAGADAGAPAGLEVPAGCAVPSAFCLASSACRFASSAFFFSSAARRAASLMAPNCAATGETPIVSVAATNAVTNAICRAVRTKRCGAAAFGSGISQGADIVQSFQSRL